uniref:Uncharacterized protein n=1 Tax=Arundo donax TaxID=35708 RepID=A0A0A9EDI5_ARUDO
MQSSYIPGVEHISGCALALAGICACAFR